MEGTILSNNQLNWLDAVLLLPALSVNLFAAISIVVSPAEDGLNTAEYTLELVAVKFDNCPPDKEISFTTKFDAASLNVNVISKESLLVVAPSLTTLPALFFAPMLMEGAMVSMIKFLLDANEPDCPGRGRVKFALFPAASLIEPLLSVNAF